MGEIPAVVGGQLRIVVRNQGALVGPDGFDEVVEARIAVVAWRRGGIALDVELGAGVFVHHLLQGVDIVGMDMACVRARMDRDARRARIENRARAVDDVRSIAAPRIAQPGDLVDVDGQHRHGFSPPGAFESRSAWRGRPDASFGGSAGSCLVAAR